MFKFSEILFEAREKKPPKEKEWNLNDAKGKLYEILLGSHLHHGTGKDGTPKGFLQHYRDEDGKRPEDVHNNLKDELEKRHPGAYEEINRHAKEGAEHLRDQLAANGHTKIHETAWTSQKGDHKRFTGEDDPASDADLMIRSENGPIGISLKYGKSKDMNLRNPGLGTLEKGAGLQSGELDAVREQHNANVRNVLGIKDHEHYKKLRAAGGTSQPVVDAADASALTAQKLMAQKVANGLAARAEQDPESLRNYVKDTIAPKTKFQHFRLHTRPDEKGNATHHLSDMQDDASKLDNFEHFRVAPHGGDTISYRIEGKRKGSDSYEPVLDQGIKKGSGPMKGFAGMTKAPFLTKVDKKKGALVTPPKRKVKAAPAPVQDDDERMASMSNEGGREPPERSLGGTHSGHDFYSPNEQQQIKGAFNA